MYEAGGTRAPQMLSAGLRRRVVSSSGCMFAFAGCIKHESCAGLSTISVMNRRGKPPSRLTTISKEMSYRLRHDPPPGVDASGWVALSELMGVMDCQPTEAEIREVVLTNDKKRFVLEEDHMDGEPAVCAAQGHSVQLEAPILTPVTSPTEVPPTVHVTSADAWALIQQDGCLRSMSRTHIHFATSAQHVRRNSWVSVRLRLDLAAAMAAGHEFFLAANGVLLCKGPLPIEFVRELEFDEPSWPA